MSKKQVVKYTRKKASPRASIATLIKREENRLRKLKEQQKLLKIRQEVQELQNLIKQGY